jgi:hypothetical protein
MFSDSLVRPAGKAGIDVNLASQPPGTPFWRRANHFAFDLVWLLLLTTLSSRCSMLYSIRNLLA